MTSVEDRDVLNVCVGATQIATMKSVHPPHQTLYRSQGLEVRTRKTAGHSRDRKYYCAINFPPTSKNRIHHDRTQLKEEPVLI